VPLQIPQWLVLSGISPQAVMLYCLYQVSIAASRRAIRSATDIPESRDDIAAALHLDDVAQVDAAHRELIAIGAVEEIKETDETGCVTTVIGINELSPIQRAEDDARDRQLAEQRAAALQEPSVSQDPPGYVYLIREAVSRLVKIGYSANVTKRHKVLQNSNPNQLDLLWHTPGDLELEGMLMERFKKRRVRGEWFDFGKLDPVKEVRRALEQIQAKNPSVAI